MAEQRTPRLHGKVAIVTGAGSLPGPGVGVGKASAAALAREGASVLLADLHPERAEETKAMIEDEGGTAVVFGGDLTRAADSEAMVRAAVESFGSVDILVNNIGLPIVGSVVDITEADWDRGLDVNLRTTFLACKFAIPVMVELGAGAVVNVSSITGMRGTGAAVYSAAKGALLALTVDMAYSHGRNGVRVNAVVPGHIMTPMIVAEYGGPGARVDYIAGLRAASGFLGTEGTAWDVAAAVTFLASDEARWITGVALPVDAGLLGTAPMIMFPHLMATPRPGSEGQTPR